MMRRTCLAQPPDNKPATALFSAGALPRARAAIFDPAMHTTSPSGIAKSLPSGGTG